MSNKFEGLFSTNRETTGPTERETVPVELKRKAVEAVTVANIIEPLAFQLGAVKMADIILQSEQQGLSRNWMFWLNNEDTEELEEMIFNLKNKVHARHEVNPDPKKIRAQEKMYDLFKSYGRKGRDILGFIEHHLGHSLDTTDIRDILGWIEQHRLNMSAENAEYRQTLKTGNRPQAQHMLKDMYKTLYKDFLQSDLYNEKFSKIQNFYTRSFNNDYHRGIFDAALQDLFFKALS